MHNNSAWKSYEFYARRSAQGFEIPIIHEIKSPSHIQHYIDKAQEYFDNGDNKAAGVYLRSAFEFILKRYCIDKVPVLFNSDISKMKTDTFWNAVKKYKTVTPACGLTPATTTQIDHLITLVLNPLSHHDVNKHEVTSEIQSALTVINTLKTELNR